MDKMDQEIEKIVGYKTWSAKRKVDKLLEMDCHMYTNLGTDSTKKDREEVKSRSKKIYRGIKKIVEDPANKDENPFLGVLLVNSGLDA